MLCKQVDTDGSGDIDYLEFVEDMRDDDIGANIIEEREHPRASVAQPVNAVGIGQNSIEGIKKFIVSKVESKYTYIASVFRKFDDNKSGKLDYDEFRKGLQFVGVPLNDKEFDMLCKEVDNDGNGDIDYLEFVQVLKDDDADAVMIHDHARSSAPPVQTMEAKGIELVTIEGEPREHHVRTI